MTTTEPEVYDLGLIIGKCNQWWVAVGHGVVSWVLKAGMTGRAAYIGCALCATLMADASTTSEAAYRQPEQSSSQQEQGRWRR